MFPQGGNETDLSNFTFQSSLQNTETRYFALGSRPWRRFFGSSRNLSSKRLTAGEDTRDEPQERLRGGLKR